METNALVWNGTRVSCVCCAVECLRRNISFGVEACLLLWKIEIWALLYVWITWLKVGVVEIQNLKSDLFQISYPLVEWHLFPPSEHFYAAPSYCHRKAAVPKTVSCSAAYVSSDVGSALIFCLFNFRWRA